MVERKAFLAKPNNQNCGPNEKYVFIVPNHQMNRDYYENPSFPYLMNQLSLNGKGKKKNFTAKPKHQHVLSL